MDAAWGVAPRSYAIEDGFNPETTILRAEPKEVKRDELLSHLVIVSEGQFITVKDLIPYVSHVAGGVHFGPPKDEKEKALHSLATQMYVTGNPAGTRTLLAIRRVVSKGLQPLRLRLE